MSRKEKAKSKIAGVLDSLNRLHQLNDMAREGPQWLAIVNAETAVHDILVTFEQELEDAGMATDTDR